MSEKTQTTTYQAAELAVMDILDVHQLTEHEQKIVAIVAEAAAKHALAKAFKNMEDHFYDGQN